MFGTEKMGSGGGDTNSLRLTGDGLCTSLRERNTTKDVVKNRMYNHMCDLQGVCQYQKGQGRCQEKHAHILILRVCTPCRPMLANGLV